MGHEDWVPSCHQHLCSEHFTPSCFQWRWGVRYLRPDAVPSIFSPASPTEVSKGRPHPWSLTPQSSPHGNNPWSLIPSPPLQMEIPPAV